MKIKRKPELESEPTALNKPVSRKTYRPFDDCLVQAIADEANPIEGTTPAKKRLFLAIAGMIEGQANSAYTKYFDGVDIKFERLNRKTERLAFLETERLIFQKKKEVEFFDTELYPMRREDELMEKLAMAVGMNVKPTPELLTIWEGCGRKAAKFVRKIPYLNKMLNGLIEVKKLEFIEEELGLQKLAAYDNQLRAEAPVAILEKHLKKREVAVLPPFEEAVKEPDKLPDLWKRLSQMERPFVNEKGLFIGNKNGRYATKIMALAQAISGIMKQNFSRFDTYEMLCTFWDLRKSNRPDKTLEQSAYLPLLTEIKHLLK